MREIKNRRGFTLIELLAVIAIIGLVIGLSTFGIIKAVDKSKEKRQEIGMNSLKDSARLYSEEADSSSWKNITTENCKYFCVTIQELINKGLVKDKDINVLLEKSDLTKSDLIAVSKNKLTEVIENEEIVKNDITDKIYKICTGSTVNETVIKLPELKEGTSYTDEIDIPFNPAELKDDSTDENGNKITPKITENVCYYGTHSYNLNKEGTVTNNICSIKHTDGGYHGSETYYVQVCSNTEKNSKICSVPQPYKTADFEKPKIEINNNDVTITYEDTNIKGGKGRHYFRSTPSGTTTSEVYKCSKNSYETCEDTPTTNIENNVWYKTNNNTVVINHIGKGYGYIEAHITDQSNNYKYNTASFWIYKVTFNKGTADKIDGSASNVERFCNTPTLSKGCTIKSPTIEKKGYNVIGWNTSSSATTSTWNVNTEKEINKDITYYPITKILSNPIITKIDNKSGGNWVNHDFDIYVYVTDEAGIESVEWSYDKSNWSSDGMTTPVKQSDGSYESHGTWSAERNQPVYLRALSSSGLYSDINSTNIKIDKTPPLAQIKVTAAGSTILTCTSGECVSSVGYSNINLGVSASDGASGINNNYTFSYNSAGSSAYTNTTKDEDRALTNGQDTRNIDSTGYRTFKFTFTDNAGNKKVITTKVLVTDFGIRYQCSNNKLSIYNITSCPSDSCYYDNLNGVSQDGTTSNNSLITSLSCPSRTVYVKSSNGLNCRVGASTGTNISQTFSNCTKMTVYDTSTSGWAYNASYGCYLSSDYLSSSYPCSSSGGSTCQKFVRCLTAASSDASCRSQVSSKGGSNPSYNGKGDCYGYFCNSCPSGNWLKA